VLQSVADSNKRMADFFDSVYQTNKGRIGTNDYATYTNNKLVASLLKGIYIELQKLNAQKHRVVNQ